MPCPGHFTPRKDQVPIVQDARWAPGLVWMDAEDLPPPPPPPPPCSPATLPPYKKKKKMLL